MPKVRIEKLVFGGQGLGRLSNKVVMAWNALPGEEVLLKIEEDHKTYMEGTAENIVSASELRIPPKEEHFLSCGPWQIISWEGENLWKKKIALEVFSRIEGVPKDLDIVHDDRQYGYRNKMEYRFASDDKGKVSLAFFGRGTNDVVPIESCTLAEDAINGAAEIILEWINRIKIPTTALRSLAVRCNEKGQAVACLFTSEVFPFINAPIISPKLAGLQVYLLTRRTPNFSEKELIFSIGDKFLETYICGMKFKMGVISFFQVNIPIFELALKDILTFVDEDDIVVDYYSGCGAIGFPVAKIAREVILVDNSEESRDLSEDNIDLNEIKNCRCELGMAERMTEFIENNKVVIFDPPRAGLHRNTIARILSEKPKRIIYLSCNLSSQARDVEKLLPTYKVRFVRLYNFFPRTPHIEGLFVLERI